MSKKMIVGWEEYKKIVEKLAIEVHKNYEPTVLIAVSYTHIRAHET